MFVRWVTSVCACVCVYHNHMIPHTHTHMVYYLMIGDNYWFLACVVWLLDQSSFTGNRDNEGLADQITSTVDEGITHTLLKSFFSITDT